MSGSTDWNEANASYLSLALGWLRACLENFVARQETRPQLPAAQAQEPESESKASWRSFSRRKPEPQGKPPSLLLPPAKSNQDPRLAEMAAALQAAGAKMDPPPALLILAQRIHLSDFERQILLLCAAMELDAGIGSLCAQCQKDPSRPFPTFALALSVLDKPSWDALSPEGPLRYWRLIEINQPGGQPLTTSALRADERIVNYIKGLNYLDDRLAPMLTPLDVRSSGLDLPPSHSGMVETITTRLSGVEKRSSPPVIQLLGADSATKQLVASEVASALGLNLYRLPAAILPSQTGDLETLARLWQRESILLPLALYLDASEASTEVSMAGHGSPVNRLLERIEGALFLDSREVWPGLSKPSLHVDAAKASPGEQESAWHAVLGSAAGESPGLLAGQFNLSLSAIHQIAGQALAQPAANQESLHRQLWNACLEHARPRLDTLAQRLEPKVTWDDLVLPAGERNLLQQIAEQVAQRTTVYEKWGFSQKMTRGLGISALFAGESGTGKTMAAEVIAEQLHLNLYRIDLSSVVSKYIGETEKNLRRLFDAAEHGGAILFFDEADALFGKRSEVKDSHDRYANIEINYLLQRMEAYRGLAILATNMKSALDQAFLRRLRFVVNFPFPSVVERKLIWQRVFPPGVPKGELDFDRLARLNITGGNIHNIALNAAFMAAKASSPVTMLLVLQAARTEFRKLERPINEMDFRWQEPKGGAVA